MSKSKNDTFIFIFPDKPKCQGTESTIKFVNITKVLDYSDLQVIKDVTKCQTNCVTIKYEASHITIVK